MLKVIDVQDTPNPDALKFMLDGTILASGVRQFDSAAAGQSDALAKELFSIPGVQAVFYMGQFVTVTKSGEINWTQIQPKINQAIADKGTSISKEGSLDKTTLTAADNELLEKINIVLNESVKPALAGDGGGLEVLGLEGFILTIHYQGACGSCPSSTAGTMVAVQNLLQRMVDPRLIVVSG